MARVSTRKQQQKTTTHQQQTKQTKNKQTKTRTLPQPLPPQKVFLKEERKWTKQIAEANEHDRGKSWFHSHLEKAFSYQGDVKTKIPVKSELTKP